jgi:hypothetical protein
MSNKLHDFKWDAPPKILEFEHNDIVKMLIEDFDTTDSNGAPQFILDCRVDSSKKNPEFRGEKTKIFLPFVTKAGKQNRSTYSFLQGFFRYEMESVKTIPYERLKGRVFATTVSHSQSADGKIFRNYTNVKDLGMAEDQDNY